MRQRQKSAVECHSNRSATPRPQSRAAACEAAADSKPRQSRRQTWAAAPMAIAMPDLQRVAEQPAVSLPAHTARARRHHVLQLCVRARAGGALLQLQSQKRSHRTLFSVPVRGLASSLCSLRTILGCMPSSESNKGCLTTIWTNCVDLQPSARLVRLIEVKLRHHPHLSHTWNVSGEPLRTQQRPGPA